MDDDDTLIRRCRFRRWNRAQRKHHKRGPFYHLFLVSELLPRALLEVGGSIQGNLVTFPKGTHVFKNIRGPVYLLSNGNSFTRGHRYELNLSSWYPSYYWEQRQKKLQEKKELIMKKHMQTIQSHNFSVLTNADCEDTGHWTTEQFKDLKLPYGEWNSDPYPLTDEESSLISSVNIMTPVGGAMRFGYSALIENKKWLMTSIQYMRPVQYPPLEREYHELVALFSPYGKVVIDQDGPPDRVTLLILVEMSIALKSFGHCNAWQRYLERGLGITASSIKEG
jgi:hypothetical protein